MRSAPSMPIALGRYAITRRIGAGGMGVVYEAVDRRCGQRVALKTLERMSASGLYRLKREFRSVADITHPNLVTLYELVAADGTWFFTMEFVDGVSFLDHVGRPSPSIQWDRLRPALLQLASAVSALHKAAKLHRDIKPANLLVTAEGRVVVLDFGLAGDAAADRDEPNVEGTPGYMSPEQAAGGSATAASDWYAVGGVLYEALTGRLPFCGSAGGILRAKLEGEPPPPSSIAPDVPADLDALCVALLRRHPQDRPAGAEVLRRLEVSAQKKKAFPSGEWAAARCMQSEPPPSCGPGALLGRDGALSALLAAQAAVAPASPVAVLVRGRSGMGKTALVQHFVRAARRGEIHLDVHAPAAPAAALMRNDGPETVRCPHRPPRAAFGVSTSRRAPVVLSCRCHERESVPYKAFDSLIDALTRHLRKVPGPLCAALLPPGVAELALLFPVLERVHAVAEAMILAASSERPAPEVRRRAVEGMKGLLRNIAAEAPLVLAVDDLQWGDRESARLLREILSPPDPPGLLFIATYRTDADSPFVRELLAHPPCDVRTVEVGPLPREDARRLALAELGHAGAGAETCADRIAAEADGSPFLVEEITRYARAFRPGAAPTLDEVLGARVAALPPDARRLLEVVAVAGGPVPRRVALEAAGVVAGGARALHVLCVGGLLRTGGVRDEDSIDTYHDRIRERVVALLGARSGRSSFAPGAAPSP